ncbi:MAG TPA: hypothetical protein VG604_00305 [Candidatus Saccharimonadales bacterium]|nr:hypothetical protein [Candidatus Saccharimonadales bacterium]
MSTLLDQRFETLFPDIPPQLGDFDRFDRLALMGPSNQAEEADPQKFFPQTWQEVNLAFNLKLRAAKLGQTAENYLDEVHTHQSKPEVQTMHPEAAVQVVTARMAGFAFSAWHDETMLSHLEEEVITDARGLDPASTLTLWQRLYTHDSLRGLRLLLRDLHVRQVARDAAFDDLRRPDPLGGVLRPTLSGEQRISDAYTVDGLPMVVAEEMKTTFSGYLASDAPYFVTRARQNRSHSKVFWNDRLVEAERNPFAQPIARPALVRLGLSPDYTPEAIAERELP